MGKFDPEEIARKIKAKMMGGEAKTPPSVDKPEEGKVYRLTGKTGDASIAAGNTLKESEVPDDDSPSGGTGIAVDAEGNIVVTDDVEELDVREESDATDDLAADTVDRCIRLFRGRIKVISAEFRGSPTINIREPGRVIRGEPRESVICFGGEKACRILASLPEVVKLARKYLQKES